MRRSWPRPAALLGAMALPPSHNPLLAGTDGVAACVLFAGAGGSDEHVPGEDQGLLGVSFPPPSGSSLAGSEV